MVWHTGDPSPDTGNVTLQMYTPQTEYAFVNNGYVDGGSTPSLPPTTPTTPEPLHGDQVKMDESGSLDITTDTGKQETNKQTRQTTRSRRNIKLTHGYNRELSSINEARLGAGWV